MENQLPPSDLVYRVSSCSFSNILMNRPINSDLPVAAYIDRLRKYFRCSDVVFICALIYIDKYLLDQKLDIHQLCIHRLLLVFLVIAVKFLEDVHFQNAYYAKVGGITTLELNSLEKSCLISIGFKLDIKPEVLISYCSQIMSHALGCVSCKSIGD